MSISWSGPPAGDSCCYVGAPSSKKHFLYGSGFVSMSRSCAASSYFLELPQGWLNPDLKQNRLKSLANTLSTGSGNLQQTNIQQDFGDNGNLIVCSDRTWFKFQSFWFTCKVYVEMHLGCVEKSPDAVYMSCASHFDAFCASVAARFESLTHMKHILSGRY